MIRSTKPDTPTKEVSTAPLNTRTASTETKKDNHEPLTWFPIMDKSASLLDSISEIGKTAKAKKAINGLKMVTTTHILRRVLGNTPFFCSSTKLAELSKPLIPNIAAENPKKSAMGNAPCFTGSALLLAKTSHPCSKRYMPAKEDNKTSEDKWKIKMTIATLEDSPLPMITNPIKTANKPMVAKITGS